MDFIWQYKLGLSGGVFKVRKKKYVGAVVYVFVSYQYLSLPLQVRLSGCSFMRWGQAQEKVWLKLMRQRWEQGLLPSLVAHGLGAERRKHTQKDRVAQSKVILMDLYINGTSRKVSVSTSPVNTACFLITVMGIGCSCQSTIQWDLSFPASNYRTQCLSPAHTPQGSTQPLTTKHQGDSSVWQNTAKHFWQSFCHLVNHACLCEINTWHLSRRRTVLFPTQPVGNVKQWGDFLINGAAGGVQIAAGVGGGDNTSHSSKRSAVFGEWELWINTVSNELWARRCSPLSKAQIGQTCWQGGVNMKYGGSLALCLCIHIWCATYPGVVWMDDRPASQRAVCWCAGLRWRCVPSICWL